MTPAAPTSVGTSHPDSGTENPSWDAADRFGEEDPTSPRSPQTEAIFILGYD